MEIIQHTQSPDFRVFEGPIYQAMPKLIEAGYVPASAAQIMRHLLGVKLDRDPLRPFGQPYDSGDAIIYYPNGRVNDRKVKLVWDSRHLCEFTPKSELCSIADGALVLPDSAWKAIDGEVLSITCLREYCAGKWLSQREALNNRVWQWLARDDKHLLKEYADRVFSITKSRYHADEAMALYLQRYPSGFAPALQLWSLGGDGSAALSRLDRKDGRLVVGVLETQSASLHGNQGGLEKKLRQKGTPRKRAKRKHEPSYEAVHPPELLIESTLAYAKGFVPDKLWNDFEAGLRRRWKR